MKKEKEDNLCQVDTQIKEIELTDKRLFFISGRAAYVARASKNGIATEVDNEDKLDLERKLTTSKSAGYFRYNRMALSQSLTNQMIEEALEEVKNARNNINDLFVVNSGLFSLEREIKNYGNKFAVAVKAKSIIDAIQEVVLDFDTKIKALDNDKQKQIKELNKEIDILKQDLHKSIIEICEEFREKEEMDKTKELSSDLLAKLCLSDSAWEKILNKASMEVKKIWKVGFTGEWIKNYNRKALDNIQLSIRSFYKNYETQSKKVLEEKLGDLNQLIVDKIKECKIDDEAKNNLLRVPKIVVGEPPRLSDQIDVTSHISQILFVKVLERKSYLDEIRGKTGVLFNEARSRYRDDYKNRLSGKISEIGKNYIENIDRYSGDLERLRDDKSSIEKDLEQIKLLVKEINEKKSNLSSKIWGGQNDQPL